MSEHDFSVGFDIRSVEERIPELFVSNATTHLLVKDHMADCRDYRLQAERRRLDLSFDWLGDRSG